MTKPARDYPTGRTPAAFAKVEGKLEGGSWFRDLRRAAEQHGKDTTWSQNNPWAVAVVNTIDSDFDTDANGYYADLLYESGLRDEDFPYDVHDY